MRMSTLSSLGMFATIALLLSASSALPYGDDVELPSEYGVDNIIPETVESAIPQEMIDQIGRDKSFLEAMKTTAPEEDSRGCGLSTEEFIANTNKLIAYAKSKKPEAYDRFYPTLDVIKDLLDALKKSDAVCSRKEYATIMAELRAKKDNQHGLPKYILRHIDNAMNCKREGIVLAKRFVTTDVAGHAYKGIKYVFDGLRDGFTEDLTPFFAEWGVSVHEFEARLGEVTATSPVSGTTCVGCVAFRRTHKHVNGPRLPELDKKCDEVIKYNVVGYCECEGHLFPPPLHGGHMKTTCDQVCSEMRTKKTPKPYKVSLRVETGGIEEGVSKMHPEVSFGDESTRYTIRSLPKQEQYAMYDFHLENKPSMSVTLHANGRDEWYFRSVDMSINSKFVSLGPVHSWLVGKPYKHKHEYGGDDYGDKIKLTPYTTKAVISFKSGSLPKAEPATGSAPFFWAQGDKFHGRWFKGGILDFSAPVKDGFRSATFTIRKDIGDITRVRFKPSKNAGSEWFMDEVKMLTTTSHAQHQYEIHQMYPKKMWLAPQPYKPKKFFGYNSHVDDLQLEIFRPKPKWDGRTCGGTAPRNSKCKFPFLHNGKTYNSCTTAGKSRYESWCFTEKEGTWAYCDCDRYTTWQGTVGPAQECKFPFKKNGKWHYDCIPATKFSNILKYPCDQGECTGNMPNGVCSVDSLYQGRWGACQPRGQVPSAATQFRYTNGQGPAKGGVQCALPFFYKGSWIKDCLGDAYGGYGWCATTTTFGKAQWGGCRPPVPEPDRYIRWPDDVTKRYGANSAPDDKCTFPFKYHGGVHYNCIDRGAGYPHGWCSLDANFKGRWGACAYEGYKPDKPKKGDRWTDGTGTVPAYTPCVFPFIYHGKKYTSCVGRNNERKYGWCSTTEVFSNKWGSCMAPGKFPPKQDCKLTEWSAWTRGDVDKGTCSKGISDNTCEGHTTRARAVLIPAKFGGKPCSKLPELRVQKKKCSRAASCSKSIEGALSNSLTGEPIEGAKITAKCGESEIDLAQLFAKSSYSSGSNSVESRRRRKDDESRRRRKDDESRRRRKDDESRRRRKDDGDHRHPESDTWTLSGSSGMYKIDGIKGSNCAISFEAEGFISIRTTITIEAHHSKVVKNLSLRPVPVNSNDGLISLTLNWAAFPSDLDAHMNWAPLDEGSGSGSGGGSKSAESRVVRGVAQAVSPEFTSQRQQGAHMFWNDKGEKDKKPFVTLDHDEMSGRGPETITMHKLIDGHFHYYVVCYSCLPAEEGKEDTEMPKSKAIVTVTRGSQQLSVPLVNGRYVPDYTLESKDKTKAASGRKARVWDVISIMVKDGKVTMKPHQKYRQHEPSFRENSI